MDKTIKHFEINIAKSAVKAIGVNLKIAIERLTLFLLLVVNKGCCRKNLAVFLFNFKFNLLL